MSNSCAHKVSFYKIHFNRLALMVKYDDQSIISCNIPSLLNRYFLLSVFGEQRSFVFITCLSSIISVFNYPDSVTDLIINFIAMIDIEPKFGRSRL